MSRIRLAVGAAILAAGLAVAAHAQAPAPAQPAPAAQPAPPSGSSGITDTARCLGLASLPPEASV